MSADAAAPHPVRVKPITLGPTMSVEAALQEIGRACLEHLRRNEPAALAGDPEGVHQMRVAARRIRSINSDLKKMIPARERRRVSRKLDRLDDTLGPVRNLDVFASDLLLPAHAALFTDPALDKLAATLDVTRQAAHARVAELIQSRRYTVVQSRLLRWFEECGWRGGRALVRSDPLLAPIGEVAPFLLARRLRRVRKRDKGFARASARQRHELRIAVKELRYTAELLGSLFDPQDVRRYAQPLKKLQDSLGYSNDVRVGREIVEELCQQVENKGKKPIAAAGARVIDWHKRAIRAAEGKVRKQLRRLNRTKPFWRPRSVGFKRAVARSASSDRASGAVAPRRSPAPSRSASC